MLPGTGAAFWQQGKEPEEAHVWPGRTHPDGADEGTVDGLLLGS